MTHPASPTLPGEALLELCRNTSGELVLAAPFIKSGTIRRLLSAVDDGVNLTCITRWRPAEIATGVSDLDVYEVVKERNGVLWLRQDLHAKYFRGDLRILVGSANLTGAAMGWSMEPNLELLVSVDRNADVIAEFEQTALLGAVEVDDELYSTITVAAEDWASLRSAPEAAVEPTEERPAVSVDRWFPVLRHPIDLYHVYQAPNSDAIPAMTRKAGIQDLAVLRPPPGLSKGPFDHAIGASLLTMPVVSLIDRYVAVSQRFGAVRDLLEDRLGLPHEEATRAWQTLIRWLRHFLPDRYEYSRPRHSEIISRASVKRQGVDTDRIWSLIVAHSGETFHQVRGRAFTYEARGRTIYLHTANRMIGRAAIENALRRVPLQSVSDVSDLSAPSYVFAILTDRRIRDGAW